MKNKNILIIIFVFMLLNTFACIQKERHIEPGDVAPDFSIMDIDSSLHTLTQYEGHQILLHFWADWCPHCRAEFSKLENAYNELKSTGFLLIGINVGQSREHVRDIQKKYNLTFPLLLDENRTLSKKYGIRGLPANYFLDSRGRVAKIVQSWLDEDQIKEIIRKM